MGIIFCFILVRLFLSFSPIRHNDSCRTVMDSFYNPKIYYFCFMFFQDFYQEEKLNFFKVFVFIWWDNLVISNLESFYFSINGIKIAIWWLRKRKKEEFLHKTGYLNLNTELYSMRTYRSCHQSLLRREPWDILKLKTAWVGV